MDEETPLLEDAKRRPQKHNAEVMKEKVASKSNDSLAGEEQVLIDNTSLSDEYIL